MTSSRLTGLEFHWFGRGQLLAERFQRGTAIELEPSVAALVGDIIVDARASCDGSASLRRVADRFALDADRIRDSDTTPSPSQPRRDIARQTAALRCLASGFATAAAEIAAARHL